MRPYQGRVLGSLCRALPAARGAQLTVMLPRQTGKNEIAARLIVWLLAANRDAGGSIIICAPTLYPQARISLERTRAVLLAVAHWRGMALSVEDNVIRHRGAMATFLSASPAAHVAGHTVYPEQHRPPCAIGRGRKHVQVEAVLILGAARREPRDRVSGLARGQARGIGLSHPVPRRRWLRSLEPKGPDRRRRERDPHERLVLLLLDTCDLSAAGLDDYHFLLPGPVGVVRCASVRRPSVATKPPPIAHTSPIPQHTPGGAT